MPSTRVAIVAIAVVCAACSGGGSSGGGARTITGRVTLATEPPAIHYQTDHASLHGSPVDHAPVGSPCSTTEVYDPTQRALDNLVGGTRPSPFADIGPGTQVVAKDATGKILAIGRLGNGSLAESNQAPVINPVRCAFPFTITNVPHSAVYTLQVSNRGDQSFSQADLNATGWRVELTLS